MQSLEESCLRTKTDQTSLLRKFTEESTLHGIREITKSPTTLFKVFWVIITLGCTCLCFFQIIVMLRQYAERPTSVNAEMAGLEELPLVAICPREWMDSVNAEQLGLTRDALYYLWTMVPSKTIEVFMAYKLQTPQDYRYTNKLNPEEGMRIVRSLLTAKNLSIYELLYNISVNITTFVCQHCAAGYPVKAMTPQGICFIAKFTNDAVFESPWLTYRVPRTATGFNRFYGVPFGHIALAIYGADIGNYFASERIALNSGNLLKYKFLFQVFTRQRGFGYADINSEDNQFKCQEDCIQRITSVDYGVNCTWLGYGLISERLTKNVSNPCAYEHWSDFLASMKGPYEFGSQISACSSDCKQPRRTITITPMAILDAVTDDGVLTDEFNTSTSVNYNFQAAASTLHIQEVPAYTWDSCIADLGGILGLWLGASVMSVIQLFYFCGLAIISRTKSKGSTVKGGVIGENLSPV